ncbi:MAG: hypothetical protein R3344_08195, partial [Acidobacteriota bacterium]|nr:hypothetical protein [Acidobacteriota bacterium]
MVPGEAERRSETAENPPRGLFAVFFEQPQGALDQGVSHSHMPHSYGVPPSTFGMAPVEGSGRGIPLVDRTAVQVTS